MNPQLFKKGSERSIGREAQQSNFLAVKEMANIVAKTLGPMGSDKMIVDPVGNITVTNDGVTILKEMQIDHPAARMIVEISKTQEEEVADGTSTVVIWAGELIKKAEELMGKGIHPTSIIKSYHKAEQKAQEILQQIAIELNGDNNPLLEKIASTAMMGKGAEGNKDFLSTMVNLAVQNNATWNELDEANRNEIKVCGIEGASVHKSSLVNGIVLDKEKMHPNMPSGFDEAKICLISSPLRIKSQDVQGEDNLTQQIAKLKELGVNMVLCERDIDEYFLSYFIENGILAVKFVPRTDMELLSKVTKAKMYNSILNIKEIGMAKVEEREIGKGRFIFIENESAVNTIFVRGATEHIVDEIKRSLTDAIGDVCAAINDGYIVGGAGAVEVIVARGLRKYAQEFIGKEQLIILAYAEAIESIPSILAENSGLDAIDLITKLRVGKDWMGINVFTGEIEDSFTMGVVEPLRIKTQALSSATEVCEMILRIDDVMLGKPISQDSSGGLQ